MSNENEGGNESATKLAQKLREAARELDKAKSTTPRRPRDCKRHEFLLSDRCFWCGTPMPGSEMDA